jgi:hypothetical protein
LSPASGYATLTPMTALESLAGAMTVGELARRAQRSVEDIVAAAFGNSTGAPSRASAPASSTPPPRDVGRGGLQLSAVVSALASVDGPAKLDDVRAKVGGSAAQVRAALQKLAAAGTVRITGERRGTRYRVG